MIPPIRIDYGFNITIGSSSFINFNCVFLDTCLISIGNRVLIGPNVSFMAGTHPLDPGLRNGTKGPELGKEILIEDDCWIGGNVSILPGVRIGKGAVLGACSVVTKVQMLQRTSLTILSYLFRMYPLFMLWRAIQRGLFAKSKLKWIQVVTLKAPNWRLKVQRCRWLSSLKNWKKMSRVKLLYS